MKYLSFLTALVCSTPVNAFKEFVSRAESKDLFISEPRNVVLDLDDATFYATITNSADSLARARDVDARETRLEKYGEKDVHINDVGPDMKDAEWLVMFYAPWCPHCMASIPHFEDACRAVATNSVTVSDQEHSSYSRKGARFAKVDATKNHLLGSSFLIRKYPTFMYFLGPKDGSRGYIYRGGGSGKDFDFFARYFYMGRHKLPLCTRIPTLDAVRKTRDSVNRVMFLFNEEAIAAGSTDLTLEASRVVEATISHGQAHFAVLTRGGFSHTLPDENDQSVGKKFKRNILKAFDVASRGPNGEKIIRLTDWREADGAEAFRGSWSIGTDRDLRFDMDEAARHDAEREKKQKPESEEEQDTEKDKEANSLKLLSLLADYPYEVGEWIQHTAFNPIEELERHTLGFYSKRGLLGIAMLLGQYNEQHKSITDEVNQCRQIMRRVNQARNTRILPLYRLNADGEVMSTDDDGHHVPGLTPVWMMDEEIQSLEKEKASEPFLTSLPYKIIRYWENSFSNEREDELNLKDVTPRRIKFMTADSKLYEEWVTELGITRADIPTFILYDADEELLWEWAEWQRKSPDEAEEALEVLRAAWGPDRNVTVQQNAMKRIETFIAKVESGELVGRCKNFVSRVAYYIIRYVPLHWYMKSSFGFGSFELVLIFCTEIVCILVIALAVMRPPEPWPEESEARIQPQEMPIQGESATTDSKRILDEIEYARRKLAEERNRQQQMNLGNEEQKSALRKKTE